jgi:hypothetical protein
MRSMYAKRAVADRVVVDESPRASRYGADARLMSSHVERTGMHSVHANAPVFGSTANPGS